ARELRQGGSDYRCCIPALAGFVSPQSIAPDGKRISPQHWHRATLTAFVEKAETLTSCDASVCIDTVKWFAWLLLAFLFATVNSCTTLVNRRDLYSPEPGPDSLRAARQGYGVTSERTPILVGRLFKRAGRLLTEWQICLDAGDICVVHARSFTQMALPLCTFC